MVGRDSFFYGDDNGFMSQESDLEQGHYPNNTYRPSTMGPAYPFHKPEIYPQTAKTLPPDPQKTLNMKIRGPSTQYRGDRERALSKVPVDELIERLISEEHQSRETRKLLKTAISHLEAATQRVTRAEEARKALEEERRASETNQALHGLKVTQGIMNAQKETAKAQQEAGIYKLQLEHAEREVQRAHTVVRTVEDEREGALRAAKKAKEFARQVNEEKLMLFAREEGRKEGFEEGMRQGRLLALTGNEDTAPRRHISDRAHATPLGSGAAFIEEYNEDEDEEAPSDGMHASGHLPPNHYNQPPDMTRSMHNKPRQQRTPRHRHNSLDSTPRGRYIASRSVLAQSQPHTPQRPASTVPASNASVVEDPVLLELEAARREAAEALRREAEQRDQIRQWHERHEKLEKEKEQNALSERERVREAELEREREALHAKDAEREREIEAIRQRERDREAERARELEERKKEQEDRKREREREREEARQKELAAAAAKIATAARPAMTLPYLPMPPPPVQIVVQPPPAPQAPVIPPPPQGPQSRQIQPQPFQPFHRRRRSSPETRSPSSSTTGISQFDIVTFPTSGVSRRSEDRDRDHARDLSDIPEVPSIRSQSRASEAPPSSPPSWITNPPVDYTATRKVNDWRNSTGSHPPSPSASPSALSPLGNDYLSPTFQPRGRASERLPSTDYRRASSGSTNSYNIIIQPPSRPASRVDEPDMIRQDFLSPNHTPRALAPEPLEPSVVIAPQEVYAMPPPGFVAYTSPSNSHTSLGRNGGNPPSSNIYSGWGGNGSPNTHNAPLGAHGPPSPGAHFADMPPSHYSANPPRPIYAPTPPALSQPLRGFERPVIPTTRPSHSQTTPRHQGGSLYGGATPGTYNRSLPGGRSVPTPPSSNGSLSSNNSYSRFDQNTRVDGRHMYDGSESPPDEATLRNTLANAASAVGALPIPPPRSRY